MDADALQILVNAAEKPGVMTFAVIFGVGAWWLLNRGIIVPGAVSTLLVKIAHLEAAEESCRTRNSDLEARILALEAQLLAHVKATS